MAKSDLIVQMQDILDEYSVELKRAANNSQDVVAKQAVQKLKNTSPKKSGEYARGWAIKRNRGKTGINEVIVYNKKKPQITHLLENGHRVVNAKGEYGRAPAHKHIEPVNDWAIDELPKEIEREME